MESQHHEVAEIEEGQDSPLRPAGKQPADYRAMTGRFPDAIME
jgi:hypothetical protein